MGVRAINYRSVIPPRMALLAVVVMQKCSAINAEDILPPPSVWVPFGNSARRSLPPPLLNGSRRRLRAQPYCSDWCRRARVRRPHPRPLTRSVNICTPSWPVSPSRRLGRQDVGIADYVGIRLCHIEPAQTAGFRRCASVLQTFRRFRTFLKEEVLPRPGRGRRDSCHLSLECGSRAVGENREGSLFLSQTRMFP
ncbi:hypothetical protein EVAR_56503_1 [Eumeta japonica]|uniref:Uncharacterized protein n=1 Tax=Eumeta variegata TaxID=151549 RepID=A0A4C1XK76_EUMVA|nr:hypothetical protein EVAR_56503_1 [Eumeta japonica]